MVCGVACLCPATDSGQVRSVYLLPMTGGLDQYLANRIAASGVFQVVTDPKKAEAIFTDKLGSAFEETLKTILPAPASEKQSDSTGESDRLPRGSSFGRGKGTLFLVDTSSRAVLWSVYEPPRNTTPNELDRTARRIVEQLQKPQKSK